MQTYFEQLFIYLLYCDNTAVGLHILKVMLFTVIPIWIVLISALIRLYRISKFGVCDVRRFIWERRSNNAGSVLNKQDKIGLNTEYCDISYEPTFTLTY